MALNLIDKAEYEEYEEYEHARLVLLVMEDEVNGVSPFSTFAGHMRREFPDMRAGRLKQLYTAYCGWDGRETPWLSVETGERL